MSITEAIEQILNLSKTDSCIVIGGKSTNTNLRWANNTTTTNGQSTAQYLTVISISKRRVGSVVAPLSDNTNLKQLVDQSEAIATQVPAAEDYTPLLKEPNALQAWQSVYSEPRFPNLGDLSTNLEPVFKDARQRKLQLFGYSETTETSYFLATSTGIRKSFSQTSGEIAINAKDKAFKKSVWAGQTIHDFSEAAAEQLYQKLLQRLDWSKTTIDLPAGRYETLLEPSAVADLLIYAYWMASAREADEGRTVYSKPGGGSRIGKKLAAPGVSIYSDPKEPGFETLPFNLVYGSSREASVFDNGLDIEKTYWFKNGVLKNLITPRYWAKKRGLKKPVPYIDNLIFEHPTGPDIDTMIKHTKRGLLVTCLWYIREVDPQNLLLTGLTRDGIFLIENGKVKGGVNNFRFNMSPIDMLKQTIEIGESVPTLPREWGDYFRLAKMPPLRVKDFNMSSVSPAS